MYKDLHKLIWLVLPIAVFVIPYLSRFGGKNADLYLYMENGWIEVSTVIFLIIAIALGALFLKSHNFSNYNWLRRWFILLILGCIYFAGEEMSWGQHIFGWETPRGWLGINDQSETNLHNTSPLFDQIPRNLLSVAALIGGILVPFYRIFTKNFPVPQSVHFWLWPTHVCIPAALFSMLVSWQEKIYEPLGIEIPAILDIRSGEVKESLLALFIMIYILSIWHRNRIYQIKTTT